MIPETATAVHDTTPLAPGGTIGVVGGGQLGRMIGVAARQLGYRMIVLDPTPDCPAAAVADAQVTAAYDDREAALELVERCDRLTFEFENVPAETLAMLAERKPTHPSPRVLETCRHRALEKSFLDQNGFPVARHRVVRSGEDAERAAGELGGETILKTAEFGYDGKGQRRLKDASQARAAWDELDCPTAVLEAVVPFERELSVICARRADGQTAVFPVAENVHENHILFTSTVPAAISPEREREARELGVAIATALDVVGLLCVELFDTAEGLVVNELAPRPHNSGHHTIESCATSQFEQHVRALCGLPLGSPECIVEQAVMTNLLGDLWSDGEPDWTGVLAEPGAALHLYGKRDARVGRKMGHVTRITPRG